MSQFKSLVLGALLASYAASPVWALDIADVPLFQSTTVAPNVMLLLDNSGSMDHITWHEGYSPSVDYPQVERCIGTNHSVCNSWELTSEGPSYYSYNVAQAGCPADQRKFRYAGVERCLYMPNPAGDRDNDGRADTRFKGNYLNYLVSQNIANEQIPTVHRMKVARDVSKSVVSSNAGMRFGLMSFDASDTDDGGRLLAGAGSTTATINTAIDGLFSDTWTPLAEAYYELTRYYRGMTPYYRSRDAQFSSPIQYRCQKNFGIVVTDGLPTYDTSFPSDDPDDSAVAANLPDWDGVGTGQSINTQYSDGPGGNVDDEGGYLYLDDMAKFAYDTDLRSTGSDTAGVSFNDPDFAKQNITTYTVGFAVDNQMLEDTAAYGHGEYYTASSAAQLNDVLSRALQSIKARTSSAAAIATNSTRLDTDTLIYQAKFNSGDWSGELIAYGINSNGTVGSARWQTGTAGLIPSAAGRSVFTHTGSAGAEFLWNNLSATQQANLAVANAADGELVVNWLRGGSSGATLSNSEVLRNRTTILGDIVNSDPVFVGAQNYGYTVPNDVAVTTEPADTYQAYLDSKSASGATKLVMVGANDGMLHAFNAETGRELFAYVPASLFAQRTGNPGDTPGLRYLTKTNYSHRYYVDGPIGVGDVYVGSAWKTYAVGGLGAGGRGVYALDISTPTSFTASNVLWEKTAPDTAPTTPAVDGSDWNDLGYTYGLPVIARMQDDTWVAIFNNGYDSNSGRAALYVVNASTGALIRRVYAGTETGNGLSAPAVMVDSNRRVTSVFAGDLKGNLWKFDLSSTTAADWRVAYETGSGPSRADAPLFKARNAAGQVQPITSGLEIGSHPNGGGLVIYFGTGKYFENSDNTVGASPQKQSFYGIWDKPGNSNATNNNGGPITSTDRSLLLQQSITTETGSYRVVSKTVMDWATKRGWYMDLVPPSGTAAGERAISLPLLRAGRIIFTTVIPSSDPCLAGGTSWLMELDAFTGGNLNYAVLDTNGDGEFNGADKIACGSGLTCDPAGMRSREGIIKTPGIVSAGDTEYKYSGGSSGNILVITEKGSTKEGRMSWRQLR